MYKKKPHASTLYHYTSSVIHIYIFTNIWKIENNNGNIKINQTTIGIKHQIIMRAGTIYIYIIFLFLCFYCSYHAPFLEVQDRHHGGGVCVARPPGQIMHVCPPCACRCASNIYPRPETSVCIPALYLNPTIRTRRRRRNPKTSLSTAINKDVFFFFRGIFSYVTVLCTCYLKLLKDCADVPFNKRPWKLVPLRWAVFFASCDYIRAKITCSWSPAGARPRHPPLCDSYIPGLGVDRHAIPDRPRVTPSAEFKSTKEQQTFGVTRFWCVSKHPSYLHRSNQTTHLSLCVPDYFSSPARSCANKSQPLIDSTTAVILGPLQ